MRGLVSRNGSECCDASCGVCDDGDETAQCSARPGGASSCCPGVITRVGRVCKSSRHTSCRFPNHHIGPATLIGWGTYARNCGEVDALARACIGCHGNNVRSVALVDESPFTAAGEEATFSCEGSTLAFRTDVVVGGHGGGGGGVGQRVWNFDKARMIFRLLLAHASEVRSAHAGHTHMHCTRRRAAAAAWPGLSLASCLAHAPPYVVLPSPIAPPCNRPAL